MVRRRGKPVLQQPAQFIERLSVLLKEGYTFDESIQILSPYHVKNKAEFDEKLVQAFLTGQSPEEILHVIGIKKRFLFAISIAQSTGDLGQALQRISENMAFHEQIQERFKKLLYYPLFLFMFIVALFVAYRRLFLPRMESMMQYKTTMDDVTSLKLSQLFLNVPDVFFYSGLTFFVVVNVVIFVISRKDVQRQLMIYSTLPVIRGSFKQTITKKLARELGNLLLHGFSLQDALGILHKQPYNKYISRIAEHLLHQVISGESLPNAIKHNAFLLARFEQFIVHGERSGTLGRELLIFADLLEEKSQGQINTLLKIIQPLLLAIIAICVLAAYLSILLPIYNMIEFV